MRALDSEEVLWSHVYLFSSPRHRAAFVTSIRPHVALGFIFSFDAFFVFRFSEVLLWICDCKGRRKKLAPKRGAALQV